MLNQGEYSRARGHKAWGEHVDLLYMAWPFVHGRAQHIITGNPQAVAKDNDNHDFESHQNSCSSSTLRVVAMFAWTRTPGTSRPIPFPAAIFFVKRWSYSNQRPSMVFPSSNAITVVWCRSHPQNAPYAASHSFSMA